MKIFISYRRDDSAGYAGRLFDYLSAHFGADNVFMDIDTIEPGEDFRQVVSRAMGTCDVVVVLIGKQWLSITNSQGQRRLDDSRDWVRMEVGSALANRRVRVIPVLVRDASMPAEHELPEGLRELAWRNAMELSDSRFQHDVRKLIEVIERIAVKTPASPRPPVATPRPAQRARKLSNNTLLFVGIPIVLIGAVVFLLWALRNLPLGANPVPTVAASPTEASLVNSTSTPPTLLPPTVTSTVPPTDTSTPEFSPTPTPQAVSDQLVNLVDAYYMCINNARHDQREDYALCWDMLSDRPGEFQDFLNQNSGGEAAFIDSWNKYKVSYVLYYCSANESVYAEYYYHEWDNLSQIYTERTILEYRFALDNAGWRIIGAYPRSEIGPSCEPQPRVDRSALFR